jgi:hypothetical protein
LRNTDFGFGSFASGHPSAPEEFEGQVKKLLAGGNLNNSLFGNIIIIPENISWSLKR